MLRAQYETRGPVPQDVIHAVEFEAPGLEAGQGSRRARPCSK